MAKKIKDLIIADEEIEWGVEYDSKNFITGEPEKHTMFCEDDEEMARMYAKILDGELVTRTIFVSAWAVAPE